MHLRHCIGACSGSGELRGRCSASRFMHGTGAALTGHANRARASTRLFHALPSTHLIHVSPSVWPSAQGFQQVGCKRLCRLAWPVRPLLPARSRLLAWRRGSDSSTEGCFCQCN